MSDTGIPKLFNTLIGQALKLESITPEVLDAYFANISEDESFVPELVSMVGPPTFLLLIEHFGGCSIPIPKIQDVIRISQLEGTLNDHDE